MKYILKKILNIFLSAVILVGTTVNFPVSADISSDIESFDIGSISNENVMKITKDINLPGYFRAANGVGYKIKWTSSKPDIISTTGRVHASADLEGVTLTAQFTSAENTDLVSSKSYSTAVLPEGKTIEYLDFNDYPDTLKNKSLNGYDNWRVTVAEDEYHGAETVLATDPADGANKLVNATRFNVHGTTATPTIYDERAGRYFKDENGANVSLAGKVYVGARIKYTPPQDGVFTYTQPFSAPGPFQLQVCSSTGVLLTEIKMFKGNRHIYYIIPSPTAENPKKTVEADSGKQISEGEWLEVGFLLNADEKKYDLYLNGELISKNLVFAHKDGFYPAEGKSDANYLVGGLVFGSLRMGGTNNWFVDDVVLRKVYGSGEPYEIKISGPAKLSEYTSGVSNTYSYKADVYDINGNKVTGCNTEFSFDGQPPEGISISGSTVTVSGNVKRGERLKLIAKCTQNPSVCGEKKITMLDRKTYVADEARLNTAIKYADKVIEAATDKTGNTPLFADGVDVGTGEFVEWKYPNNDNSVAMSNLANQSNLMKSFVALSRLTDIEKYENRVQDIYSYYINNFIDPQSGMVYWGGHTTIDLKTGQRAPSMPDVNTHEIKTHMPYIDPFFELDPDVGKSIIKSTWAGHVTDFSSLVFSRHAKYFKEYNTDSRWYDIDAYSPGSDPIIVSRSQLPFKLTANDLIYFACKMYRYTGDRESLEWARRLSKRYVNIRNSETLLGGGQFTTASCPEAKAALAALEAEVGMKWYDIPPDHPSYDSRTFANYGDRAENQFADFAGNGYIPADPAQVREYNVVTPSWTYGSGALAEMALAESLGLETDEGAEVLYDTAVGMAAWARLAYMPEKNAFKKLWADGTDMTGYVTERSGYYYNKDRTVQPITATTEYLLSYSRMFLDIGDRADLRSERSDIWSLVRNIASAYGLGELGCVYPGDNMTLNMQTTANDPIIIYALTNLYQETGISEYLDLARRVADNMIYYYYNNGYFMASDKKYARFDSECFYALVLLDASIRGEFELAGDPLITEPFYSANYEYPDGSVEYKAYDTSIIWPQKKTEQIITEYEIYNNSFDMSAEYENCDVSRIAGFRKGGAEFAATVSKTPDMNDAVSFEAANKAIKVVKTTLGTSKIYKSVVNANGEDVNLSGVSKFTVRVMPVSGGSSAVALNNEAGEQIAGVRLSGGNITAGGTAVGTYTDNKWNELSIEIDSAAGQYSVYVNGEVKASSLVMETTVVTPRDMVFSFDDAATWYIDDINITSTETPKPYAELSFRDISTEKSTSVTRNLNLIKSFTDKSGTEYDVSWHSEDENVLSDSGVITRGNDYKTVFLDAELKRRSDGVSLWKRFNINVPALGLVNAYENFEGGTVGRPVTSLAGWTLYSGATGAMENMPLKSYIAESPDENGKVLMLHRTEKSTANQRPKKQLSLVHDGDIGVNFSVYCENEIPDRFSVNLLNEQKACVAMLYISGNTISNSKDAGSTRQLSATAKKEFESGKWYNFILKTNKADRTFDVYLEGEKINAVPYEYYYDADKLSSSYQSDDIAYIEFDIKKEVASESKWYIDDVESREISDAVFDIGAKTYKNSIGVPVLAPTGRGTVDTVKLTKLRAAGTVTLVAASYDGDCLHDIKLVDIPENTEYDKAVIYHLGLSLPQTVTDGTVKIFVLDGMGTLLPLPFYKR